MKVHLLEIVNFSEKVYFIARRPNKVNGGAMAKLSDYDVAVVGLGPTGMTAAALLANMNHRVVVFERHDTLYGLPRAGHVDHEIVRILQDLGVHEQFLADAFETEDYKWYNRDREVILSFPWGGMSESGFNSDFMMYQPVLEDAIFSTFQRHPESVTLHRGWEITSCENADPRVTLRARRFSQDPVNDVVSGNDSLAVTAKYVIAADGARSKIRQCCGIGRDEQEFNATWLDVDVRVKRPLARMNPHQVCDPRRPAFISPLGKRHHRFEWCVLPGESMDEFGKPAKAWELLAEQGVGPDDVEIVRQLVYTFEARVAHQWRQGRVLLAGDAAHTMPPFMGQGACSGMRDSANLAWKLDLILRKAVPDTVLDSYQVEREPHTRTWIDLSIRSGDVSCTLDAAKAAERDADLRSGNMPPMPEFPTLTSGMLLTNGSGAPLPPAGTLFIQRNVSRAGRLGPFDDIVGRGFLLVGAHGDPRSTLPPSALKLLTELEVTVSWVAEDHDSSAEAFSDISGDYRAYFEKYGLAAVLVRPDHYVYGGAALPTDIPSLLSGMAASLRLG
jgi:3-(3-hydroxy-phenyl)propionate hydroxylase